LPRPVTIVADDYGIGRQTSRGILDLAVEGRITGAVLIVNGPDAGQAAREWLAASPPADLGWHPNLTLDRPILAPTDVSSLVRPDGTFWPLGAFLTRVCLGRVRAADVRAEWRAQYRRFVELVGRPPALVNSHQHVSLFPPCDEALLEVLSEQDARPYVRRVVERGSLLARVAGARVKRTTLTLLGRRAARRAAARGLPGCDWLAGVTDPECVIDDRFWANWLGRLADTGSVEVCCHPGYHDESLVGRDCDPGAGLLRRPREATLLRAPSFRAACDRAGLVPVRPSALPGPRTGGP
jgi:chitin disaccharide deacetylase